MYADGANNFEMGMTFSMVFNFPSGAFFVVLFYSYHSGAEVKCEKQKHSSFPDFEKLWPVLGRTRALRGQGCCTSCPQHCLHRGSGGQCPETQHSSDTLERPATLEDEEMLVGNRAVVGSLGFSRKWGGGGRRYLAQHSPWCEQAGRQAAFLWYLKTDLFRLVAWLVLVQVQDPHVGSSGAWELQSCCKHQVCSPAPPDRASAGTPRRGRAPVSVPPTQVLGGGEPAA